MGYRILGRITKTRTRLYLPALIALGLMALLLVASGSGIQALAPPPSGGAIITRVSVSSFGVEGNFNSFGSSVSADGRYVAFDSYASNVVPGDSNSSSDVFVRDLQTGATTRVSVSSAGAEANGDSLFASISADGRYVAFHSLASNLVVGDTNGVNDVFVHDRDTGVTTRVSVSSLGVEVTSTASTPASAQTGASSPSTPRPPPWCRETPTAQETYSSTTVIRESPPVSQCPRQASKATATACLRASARTGASSPSVPSPPTWLQPTPMLSRTYSSTTVILGSLLGHRCPRQASKATREASFPASA